MNYEVVIGLEIHAQLLTASKLFCGCSTKFGDQPNTNICPVCTGQPGVLPVLNKRAVEFALKTAIAVNCKTIRDKSVFARKNYFYPDLPKNYQVSQFELPLAEHGCLEVTAENKKTLIGITRIHLEEDAGKLVHQGSDRIQGATYSLVDFNRTGVPLMEIVSEPDIRSPEEARAYVQTLREILIHLGVCDGNMEEGSLRCDANISIRPAGQKELGTKTELKNMNSTKALRDGLEAEIERQIQALDSGEKIIQETRHYDEKIGRTISLRSKEESHDYRYFPEPDLIPADIDEEMLDEAKNSIGELPQDKKKRFMAEHNLPEADADVILGNKAFLNLFEKAVTIYDQAKIVSNWIIGDINAYLKEHKTELEKTKITAEHLAEMLKELEKGVISGKIAKELIIKIIETGKSVSEIIKESGMQQISDEGELVKIVQQVIKNNPKSAADYKGGKANAVGFLVGQVMKASKGKANPAMATKILKQELGKIN